MHSTVRKMGRLLILAPTFLILGEGNATVKCTVEGKCTPLKFNQVEKPEAKPSGEKCVDEKCGPPAPEPPVAIPTPPVEPTREIGEGLADAISMVIDDIYPEMPLRDLEQLVNDIRNHANDVQGDSPEEAEEIRMLVLAPLLSYLESGRRLRQCGLEHEADRLLNIEMPQLFSEDCEDPESRHFMGLMLKATLLMEATKGKESMTEEDALVEIKDAILGTALRGALIQYAGMSHELGRPGDDSVKRRKENEDYKAPPADAIYQMLIQDIIQYMTLNKSMFNFSHDDELMEVQEALYKLTENGLDKGLARGLSEIYSLPPGNTEAIFADLRDYLWALNRAKNLRNYGEKQASKFLNGIQNWHQEATTPWNRESIEPLLGNLVHPGQPPEHNYMSPLPEFAPYRKLIYYPQGAHTSPFFETFPSLDLERLNMNLDHLARIDFSSPGWDKSSYNMDAFGLLQSIRVGTIRDQHFGQLHSLRYIFQTRYGIRDPRWEQPERSLFWGMTAEEALGEDLKPLFFGDRMELLAFGDEEQTRKSRELAASLIKQLDENLFYRGMVTPTHGDPKEFNVDLLDPNSNQQFFQIEPKAHADNSPHIHNNWIREILTQQRVQDENVLQQVTPSDSEHYPTVAEYNKVRLQRDSELIAKIRDHLAYNPMMHHVDYRRMWENNGLPLHEDLDREDFDNAHGELLGEHAQAVIKFAKLTTASTKEEIREALKEAFLEHRSFIFRLIGNKPHLVPIVCDLFREMSFSQDEIALTKEEEDKMYQEMRDKMNKVNTASLAAVFLPGVGQAAGLTVAGANAVVEGYIGLRELGRYYEIKGELKRKRMYYLAMKDPESLGDLVSQAEMDQLHEQAKHHVGNAQTSGLFMVADVVVGKIVGGTFKQLGHKIADSYKKFKRIKFVKKIRAHHRLYKKKLTGYANISAIAGDIVENEVEKDTKGKPLKPDDPLTKEEVDQIERFFPNFEGIPETSKYSRGWGRLWGVSPKKVRRMLRVFTRYTPEEFLKKISSQETLTPDELKAAILFVEQSFWHQTKARGVTVLGRTIERLKPVTMAQNAWTALRGRPHVRRTILDRLSHEPRSMVFSGLGKGWNAFWRMVKRRPDLRVPKDFKKAYYAVAQKYYDMLQREIAPEVVADRIAKARKRLERRLSKAETKAQRQEIEYELDKLEFAENLAFRNQDEWISVGEQLFRSQYKNAKKMYKRYRPKHPVSEYAETEKALTDIFNRGKIPNAHQKVFFDLADMFHKMRQRGLKEKQVRDTMAQTKAEWTDIYKNSTGTVKRQAKYELEKIKFAEQILDVPTQSWAHTAETLLENAGATRMNNVRQNILPTWGHRADMTLLFLAALLGGSESYAAITGSHEMSPTMQLGMAIEEFKQERKRQGGFHERFTPFANGSYYEELMDNLMTVENYSPLDEMSIMSALDDARTSIEDTVRIIGGEEFSPHLKRRLGTSRAVVYSLAQEFNKLPMIWNNEERQLHGARLKLYVQSELGGCLDDISMMKKGDSLPESCQFPKYGKTKEELFAEIASKRDQQLGFHSRRSTLAQGEGLELIDRLNEVKGLTPYDEKPIVDSLLSARESVNEFEEYEEVSKPLLDRMKTVLADTAQEFNQLPLIKDDRARTEQGRALSDFADLALEICFDDISELEEENTPLPESCQIPRATSRPPSSQ